MITELKPITAPSEYVAAGEPYDCTGLIGELGSDAQWPMYSYSRPGSIVWNAIASTLNKEGWTDEEIETWLASKNARWALDGELGDALNVAGQEFAKSITKSQLDDCD
ncbi:MAG TPA: hypothetical protein VF848_04230 [Steroidobacteraceae bacterium]